MKPESMINMVKRFNDQYGVKIVWHETEHKKNSRGNVIKGNKTIERSAKVMILKDKYSLIKPIEIATGLGQDYGKYMLAMPDIKLERGTVITDNHGIKWKLGVIDFFDVGGVPVAQQIALLEVS